MFRNKMLSFAVVDRCCHLLLLTDVICCCSKQVYLLLLQADVAAVTLSKADEVGGSVRVISRSMTVTSGGRMKHQSPGSAKSDRDRTGRTWPEDRDILVALTKGARKKDVPSGSENVIDKMKGILQVGKIALDFCIQ